MQGWLEHQRFDRWALQLLHSWLVPDGILVLDVPNLLSARSLLDPRYVAGKLAKQLPRLERMLGRTPRPAAPSTAPKTYDARRLAALLEDLGFAVERGPGGGPARFAPRLQFVARRLPSIFGLAPERPYPEAAAFRARFEREHVRETAIRDAWWARHPGERSRPAREIDPAEFAGRTVLVLAPHPDDELIGCGGTLDRMIAAGARVTVVQVTDGSASATFRDEPDEVRRTQRLEEANRVARSLGVERTIEWREDNRNLAYRPELARRLCEVLDEVDPALVLVPFVTDIHPDHVLIARLLATALAEGRPRSFRILGYEIWCRIPANAWCDVTSVMNRLEERLFLYPTAMKVDDFVFQCSARNYVHALELAGRPGFVEAFHESDVARFRTLVPPL